MERAEQQRRENDFSGERDNFARAASAAEDDSDRVEALYRKAHSQRRQGHLEAAEKELLHLARAYPESPRAARAWLDLGRIFEEKNQVEAARRAFLVLVKQYPDSGNALTGAKRLVALSGSLDKQRRTLRELLRTALETSLEEGLRFEWAKSFERDNAPRAIAEYQTLVRRFPLPRGTFTDDALLRSALLRRNEGDSVGALRTLAVLLDHDERAWLLGSYSRESYLDGLWLQAEIQRDDLQNCSEARKTFLEIVRRFPSDRSGDDALLMAARCERTMGLNPCATVSRIEREFPHSSLLSCARQLCPNAPERTTTSQRMPCDRVPSERNTAKQ